MTSRKKISNEKSSKNINLFTEFNCSIEKSKKCNLKNAIGLITPKNADSFSLISIYNSKTEPKNKKEINQTTPTPENQVIKIRFISTTNKDNTMALSLFDLTNSLLDKENKEPDIPQFKATQEYYREIDKDSKESLIPCKPMLNSTSSKAFMYEYSKSKKYQEDKINFFSTNDTVSISEEPVLNPNKFLFQSTDTKSPIIEDNEDNISNNDMELEDLLKFQESNLPVPLRKKDDESFKLLTMKKMKRKTMPPNKSVRKFAEDIEPLYEKEFRIQNNFCNLLKRKLYIL